MYSDIYERQSNGDLKLIGNLAGSCDEVLARWRERYGNNYGQLIVLPMLDHKSRAFDTNRP